MKQQTRKQGLLLVALATILWSTSGFFAKAPLLEFWSSEQRGDQIAFWRVFFAAGVLIPLVRRPQWTWRLLPAGVFFALMNFCYLKALTTTTAANAIWLQYTAPTWVFVFGVLLFKEPFRGGDLLMVVFSLMGIAVIVGCELRFVDSDPFGGAGVFWGLAAGLMYAGVIVTIRALRDLESAWVVAICHVSAAVFMLPWIVSAGRFPPIHVLGWVMAFGIFQLGLPYLLFARGTRVVTGHEAAFICLLEPLLVPLWTFAIWRHAQNYQPPAAWTIIGGSLILLGLLIRFVGATRGEPTPSGAA